MNSFIGWIGGKKLLRNEICNRFPADLDRYIEVFGGAGWVLFHKDRHADFEVYNDINGELVNLFRCMKHHPEAVIKESEFMLNSRETFKALYEMNPQYLTEIQRAARYLFLVRYSYGNNVRQFGGKRRKYIGSIALNDVQSRLEMVIIENKNYEALIKQYDSENALFYCDPPYFKAEKFYNTGDSVFDENEHIKLKDSLSAIKGRFILSYNDCEFVRDLYKGFNVEEIQRQNNLAGRYGKDKVYEELIIRNY